MSPLSSDEQDDAQCTGPADFNKFAINEDTIGKKVTACSLDTGTGGFGTHGGPGDDTPAFMRQLRDNPNSGKNVLNMDITKQEQKTITENYENQECNENESVSAQKDLPLAGRALDLIWKSGL